ncbi:MAG: ABC transporter substrate-binding protein [Chloroflexota bacterium]
MFKERLSALTNRRRLIVSGAAATGAVVTAAGFPAHRARAIDSVDDSRLKKVLDRGKLIVGTGAANPPWHFEDDNGQLIGMDIDMAKLVAGGLFGLSQEDRRTEKPRDYIEFVVQEANQRIPNLLTDKVDVNFQFMTVTAARATQVEFTIPYYREAVTILLLKDSPYNTLADLQGKKLKIAILQNVGADELVWAGVPDAEVIQVPSVADSVAALDAGRVDGTAIDLSTGQWFSAQSPDKYKYVPESWSPQTYAASVKPGDQIWLNFLNSAIHELLVGLDFSLYQASFKRWFGVDLAPPSAGFPVEFK